MELSAYGIIKRIIMTGKSGDLYQKQGKLTLEVAKHANKIEIRKAVESIWDVKVAAVRTSMTPQKVKTFGRRSFTTSGMKKAIISLKEGYSIAMPGQVEAMGTDAAEGK